MPIVPGFKSGPDKSPADSNGSSIMIADEAPVSGD